MYLIGYTVSSQSTREIKVGVTWNIALKMYQNLVARLIEYQFLHIIRKRDCAQ